MRIPELTAEQVHEAMSSGEQLCIIDCREGFELSFAKLPFEVLHVPLMQLEDYADQMPQDRRIVVMCHHGIRSMSGAMMLLNAGVTQVYSMSGGIDRWSRRVDSQVGRY